MNWPLNLLISTVAGAAPLILAAMGGFASERGGVINIALEGNMLMGAVSAAIIGALTGNPWLGLAGACGVATLMSWTHRLLTQRFHVDHIVSGMALNAFALGASNFLAKLFTNPAGGELPGLNLNAYFVAAVVLPFAISLYGRCTRGGLRLIAVGNDPVKARQMGLLPSRIRLVGLTVTGLCCGLSGALIVTNARYFTDNMTAGRGYIALAALILGSWRPIPTFIACLAFGLFQALQFQFQGSVLLGFAIPREFWFSLPYLITIVALAGFVGKSRVPAGLGRY